LPGPAIDEGVLTPMMYFARYGYIGQNLVLQTDPPNSRPSIRSRAWRYSQDTLLVPGRSESWQIEVGADDSVWAVDDSRRLFPEVNAERADAFGSKNVWHGLFG
jgi:hypothetical protein